VKRFSSKDLAVLEPPSVLAAGVGVFTFSDRYSVFHYGRMPDLIPRKGEAIAAMARQSFDVLHDASLRTHLRRFVGHDRFECDLLRILDPAEAPIAPGTTAYFVPLQIVFRNTLPRGSSLLRRLCAGEISPADVGLDHVPQEGETLAQTIVEFTTKLEEIDRFISADAAQHLSGLDDRRFAEVADIARAVDAALSHHAASVGLVHADGKIEVGVGPDGGVVLVDVAGTADENRFLLDDHHVSKEVLRQFYAPLGIGERVRDLVARGVPRSAWPLPQRLPREFVTAVAELYLALAERWTGDSLGALTDLPDAAAAVHSLLAARTGAAEEMYR
jgi:phosphoribosylaminoimidazole-succinocarboxamide synthase